MLIGELSKRTNTTKDAIRLYERRGYITSYPTRADSRIYRDYPEEVVGIIESIRQARAMGVPLKEWKVFYDEWSQEDITNAHRQELLHGEILKIRTKIKQLRYFEKLLLNKSKQYTVSM